MNTDGTDNDGRQEPRTRQTANGGFSRESVFGDADWIAEHLDWIKQHYAAGKPGGEATA